MDFQYVRDYMITEFIRRGYPQSSTTGRIAFNLGGANHGLRLAATNEGFEFELTPQNNAAGVPEILQGESLGVATGTPIRVDLRYRTERMMPKGIIRNGDLLDPELVLAEQLVDQFLYTFGAVSDKKSSATVYELGGTALQNATYYATSFGYAAWCGYSQPLMLSMLIEQLESEIEILPVEETRSHRARIQTLRTIAETSARARKVAGEWQGRIANLLAGRLLEDTCHAVFMQKYGVSPFEADMYFIEHELPGEIVENTAYLAEKHAEILKAYGIHSVVFGGETSMSRAVGSLPELPFAAAKVASLYSSKLKSKDFTLNGESELWLPVRYTVEPRYGTVNEQGIDVDAEFAKTIRVTESRTWEFIPKDEKIRPVVSGDPIEVSLDEATALVGRRLFVSWGKVTLGQAVMPKTIKSHRVPVLFDGTEDPWISGVEVIQRGTATAVRVTVTSSRALTDGDKVYVGGTKGTVRLRRGMSVPVAISFEKAWGGHFSAPSLIVTSVIRKFPELRAKAEADFPFMAEWDAIVPKEIKEGKNFRKIATFIAKHFGLKLKDLGLAAGDGFLQVESPIHFDSHTPERMCEMEEDTLFTHVGVHPYGAYGHYAMSHVNWAKIERILANLKGEYTYDPKAGTATLAGKTYQVVQVTRPLVTDSNSLVVREQDQTHGDMVEIRDGREMLVRRPEELVDASFERSPLHPDKSVALLYVLAGGGMALDKRDENDKPIPQPPGTLDIPACPARLKGTGINGLLMSAGNAFILFPDLREEIEDVSFASNDAMTLRTTRTVMDLSYLISSGMRPGERPTAYYGKGADATWWYCSEEIGRKLNRLFGSMFSPKTPSADEVEEYDPEEAEEKPQVQLPGTIVHLGIKAIQNCLHVKLPGARFIADMDPDVDPGTIEVDPDFLDRCYELYRKVRATYSEEETIKICRKKIPFFCMVGMVVVVQRPPVEPEAGTLALRVVRGKKYESKSYRRLPRCVINTHIGVHILRCDRDGDILYGCSFHGAIAKDMLADHGVDAIDAMNQRLALALSHQIDGLVIDEPDSIKVTGWRPVLKYKPLLADRFSSENQGEYVAGQYYLKSSTAYTCLVGEYKWRSLPKREAWMYRRAISVASSLVKNGAVDKDKKIAEALGSMNPIWFVDAVNEGGKRDDYLIPNSAIEKLATWSDAPTEALKTFYGQVAYVGMRMVQSVIGRLEKRPALSALHSALYFGKYKTRSLDVVTAIKQYPTARQFVEALHYQVGFIEDGIWGGAYSER